MRFALLLPNMVGALWLGGMCLRQLLKVHRQSEIKCRSFAHHPFCPDLPAVALDDTLRRGKPYSDPLELRTMQSLESLK